MSSQKPGSIRPVHISQPSPPWCNRTNGRHQPELGREADGICHCENPVPGQWGECQLCWRPVYHLMSEGVRDAARLQQPDV